MLNKYTVLVDDVQIPGMEGIVKGAVVELDPEGDVTKELLASSSIVAVVVPAIGDVCVTDDGKAGTLQGDPLVCVATEIKVESSSTEVPPEEVPVEKVKHYRGQEVIVDGMRTVDDKEYHHVTLADGEQMDFTNEEYEAEIYLA